MCLHVHTLFQAALTRIGMAGSVDPVGRVLTAFAQDTADHPVTFVQVGSNDGTTDDPLRSLAEAYGWSGVLVEPVPYVFSRLKQERGWDQRLRLENVAIGDHDGEAEFFHLRQLRLGQQLPEWYDQLGSFSLEIILSPEHVEQIPGIRDLVVRTTVRTLTFESLCAKHEIERFDLLHIDAEGYDWEILRRIELERYRPLMVLFEHRHLTPQDQQCAQMRLELCGYAWHQAWFDTLAVRRGALGESRALGRAWRRIGGASL
jgi:FkbM family methyltransferase